jgi:hypothetical protein
MNKVKHHSAWQYPGFKTLDELIKNTEHHSFFLNMLLYLQHHRDRAGEDEFYTRKSSFYEEHFLRHKHHFEIILDYFGCPDEIHDFFLRYDLLIERITQITQDVHPGDDDYYDAFEREEDAYYQIHDLINRHKNNKTQVLQIKFIAQDPSGTSKVFSVNDELSLEEILYALSKLPAGKKRNAKRGRTKRTNQQTCYKRVISACFDFITKNFDREFSLTDKLFFCALCLSVVLLEYNTPIHFDESMQDYKETVSDHLKYYL